MIDTDDVNPKGKVRTGVTTNLSLKHLNSNSAVRVTGADNDAVELHRSEIEADLQLSVYHKVLRCKHQLNQSVHSEIARNKYKCCEVEKEMSLPECSSKLHKQSFVVEYSIVY